MHKFHVFEATAAQVNIIKKPEKIQAMDLDHTKKIWWEFSPDFKKFENKAHLIIHSPG